MKKIGLMISLMILLLTIAACGNDQKTMEQKKTASWQITPTKMMVQDSSEKGNQELVISYKVKNISKENQGIVAADFFLTDNDEHYFYAKGSLKNINEVLKPGEEKEGKGYYIIPKDLEKADLIYSPINSKEKTTWKNVQFQN
ncbi:hypothetical protein X560_2053 [Listeria fleischmannii 1991]|uniref:Telomeric repeat-binding factor 2 n=2 Tax=Listeria fleischmannii TaxID=1069827 RepID=A0A2X3HHY3_9LIST|nr:DUF4352 domain-containing protein [Listeria fleischmannii]EMG29437.1 hypothetical protein LFLEISCH_00765 [Listeria fleischmannii subsp. fleischmannii LU2006-1]KMT58641.1 hypothetical protein X560_2053 [Listeria fleischmannii 1991]SQC71861.1 Telomeric repeat-binding factor 2 [Listeria fleischmannii subsp. fleischmannii]